MVRVARVGCLVVGWVNRTVYLPCGEMEVIRVMAAKGMLRGRAVMVAALHRSRSEMRVAFIVGVGDMGVGGGGLFEAGDGLDSGACGGLEEVALGAEGCGCLSDVGFGGVVGGDGCLAYLHGA